ncbi:penicillin-binding protein activator [Salinisphaera hydrothermalis]|uniref:LppC family lipoprotein n=1 Tax=Salinisphaera hydrothermalis (strain C41B8) TaxID=1304275 RepID=A0A084IP80_SALHC|nr:penicillin-binding protein activator [Salinisphaera hydrothermalis]KEZ78514.1 LppC family lipoprotein [Salinisphaera hydrothermalis C41B8]
MTLFKAGLRATAIVAAALAMAGCASQMAGGPSSKPSNPADAAAQAAETSHYKTAVREYMRAASQASQPAAQRRYRLEAGLAAAQGGDAQTAQQLLGGIDPSQLDPTNQARYNLAQREISIAGMSPDQALTHLPKPARNTAPAVAQRVWEKRADLHFANDEPVQGIEALVQRDVWLMNDRAMRANDNRIYDKSLDAIGLGIGPNSRAAKDAGKTTRGWLALAQIGQQPFADRTARDKAIAQWQKQYPGHPANRTILADRFHYKNATQVTRQKPGQMLNGQAPQPTSDQVALALPLTGQFQNAAQAIRDGFMFAYQNNPAGMPQPLIYDSNTMSPQALLSRAESDNVGILVGPLDKSKVQAMSDLSLPMPEIALNTSSDADQRPGFYQFGLAPEDEAASAAAHAVQAGYTHALALVPSGDWGDRVLDAFRSALAARGGQLVGYQTYDESSHDHSQAIQQVLANQNNADFIFVAAQPLQARLIRSQLKYYHAADLPMVTTSHAFSGTVNPGEDIDLDDVHFVDMPWLLGHGGTITRLRSEAADAYGDEAKSYARLFAMGMDAWLLAHKLDQSGLSTGQPIEGMSGVLSIQPDGYIKRYLGWAVFHNGRPQTLSMPSISQAKSGDSYAQQQQKNNAGNGNSLSAPRSGNNAVAPTAAGPSTSSQSTPAAPSSSGNDASWSSGD